MARPTRLLDLGCGRGGDVSKYNHLSLEVLHGVDVSEPSIEEARRRARAQDVDGTFGVTDLRDPEQTRALEDELSGQRFDTVVCFFALQYLPEWDIRRVLGMARRLTVPGGCLILTLPASARIRKLAAAPGELATARFDEADPTAYRFSLFGAIDDCPEFLVPPEGLQKIIRDLGWRLDVHVGFLDAIDMDPVLLGTMGADAALSPVELEVVALYDVWIARVPVARPLPFITPFEADQRGDDHQDDASGGHAQDEGGGAYGGH